MGGGSSQHCTELEFLSKKNKEDFIQTLCQCPSENKFELTKDILSKFKDTKNFVLLTKGKSTQPKLWQSENIFVCAISESNPPLQLKTYAYNEYHNLPFLSIHLDPITFFYMCYFMNKVRFYIDREEFLKRIILTTDLTENKYEESKSLLDYIEDPEQPTKINIPQVSVVTNFTQTIPIIYEDIQQNINSSPPSQAYASRRIQHSNSLLSTDTSSYIPRVSSPHDTEVSELARRSKQRITGFPDDSEGYSDNFNLDSNDLNGYSDNSFNDYNSIEPEPELNSDHSEEYNEPRQVSKPKIANSGLSKTQQTRKTNRNTKKNLNTMNRSNRININKKGTNAKNRNIQNNQNNQNNFNMQDENEDEDEEILLNSNDHHQKISLSSASINDRSEASYDTYVSRNKALPSKTSQPKKKPISSTRVTKKSPIKPKNKVSQTTRKPLRKEPAEEPESPIRPKNKVSQTTRKTLRKEPAEEPESPIEPKSKVSQTTRKPLRKEPVEEPKSPIRPKNRVPQTTKKSINNNSPKSKVNSQRRLQKVKN